MYWYRWSPERQQFEFLLFSNSLGKSTYGSNVNQEKFSVRGSSSQSYSLHIGQLHASDAGMYYCSVSQSSELVLGSGTRLGVGEHRPRGAQKCRWWAATRGCVVVDGLSRFGIQGSGSGGFTN